MALPVGPKRERQYRADRGQAVISTRPCEPDRQLSAVLASPSDNCPPSLRARAKRGRSNPERARLCRGLWIASAASPPRNDGGNASPSLRARAPSEREAIQKRRGNAVRPPPIPCGAARLDCVGGFAASQ